MTSVPATLMWQSDLWASRDALWAWLTDVHCLRREMMAVLAMIP